LKEASHNISWMHDGARSFVYGNGIGGNKDILPLYRRAFLFAEAPVGL
jgi:hypothetical protein